MDALPQVVDLLVTPPGIVVILLFITFLAYMRRYWLGTAMLAISTTLLVILSLPLTAHTLLASLESIAKPPVLVPQAEKSSQLVPQGAEKDPPQAIVVLGSGRYVDAPEFDNEDNVTPLGLERLRYAAMLQRKTGLPILVSGGSPEGETTPEAELMRKTLVEDFRANVKWLEKDSRNTLQNGHQSATILLENKIRHVYVVTQAWHMRRAMRAFETTGIRVTPAPVGFHTLSANERASGGYLPSGKGMQQVSLAVRERLAFFWLEWRDTSSNTAAPESSAPASGSKPAR
jgi:uncharacterized SAM-binding protein YcdF (DUF218 family)